MKVEDKVLTPEGTGFVTQVDMKYEVIQVKLDTAESEPKHQTFEPDELTVLDDVSVILIRK